MELTELRKEIDRIDDALVDLFCRRMSVAARVADYKKAAGSPIYHPGRELEILEKVAKMAGPELDNYTRVLYSTLFELSRGYQRNRNRCDTSLSREIAQAIENTQKHFPRNPTVACRDGSRIPCEKIFENPIITCFPNFEAVFTAIEQGQCRYGILPMEDSSAGSVTEVYDLLIRYPCYIVGSFRDNGTRFVCVSRNPEIYPRADQTSVMMILPHRPGALYKVLARIYTLGINITKLESRPIPDRDSAYMFFFDLDTSMCSEEYMRLICQLDELSGEFRYLGSYTEVV